MYEVNYFIEEVESTQSAYKNGDAQYRIQAYHSWIIYLRYNEDALTFKSDETNTIAFYLIYPNEPNPFNGWTAV